MRMMSMSERKLSSQAALQTHFFLLPKYHVLIYRALQMKKLAVRGKAYKLNIFDTVSPPSYTNH
jgi:hypothetical protein